VIRDRQPLGRGYAAFQAAFGKETGRQTALSRDAFVHATAPETFVACRDRPGGPAPKALDAAFERYRRSAGILEERRRCRLSRISKADAARTAAFDAVLET
jgi:argininosuccinate lyase